MTDEEDSPQARECPDCFFDIGWRFIDELSLTEHSPGRLLADLVQILDVTARHELLVPQSIRIGRHCVSLAEVPPGGPPGGHERQLQAVLGAWQGDLDIEDIRGYGMVERADGTRAPLQNLLYIRASGLARREYYLLTRKSLWTPISLDRTFHFDWQTELADRNGPRLERCMREIHAALGDLSCQPAPDELDRDEPIWIFDFKLYTNPEILRREFECEPPPGLASIDRYLCPGDDRPSRR